MDIEAVRGAWKSGLLDYSIERALEMVNSGASGSVLSELYQICSDIMFQKAQYTDAVIYGEKSIEADGGNDQGYSCLGWAEYWLGRNNEAAEHLEKAVELDPGKAEHHYRLGSIYHNAMGRLPEAEEHFTRAVELDPDHSLAFQQRGIARYNQGKYDEAESDYRKAAELGDSYSAYCLQNNGSPISSPGEKVALARDFWNQNDTQSSVDYLKQAIEQGFDSPERTLQVILELADKLSMMKWNDEAELNYGKAIEEFPDSADAHSRRGWHYYLTSQDDAAAADLSRAMKLEPGNPLHVSRMGNLMAVTGKAAEGIDILSRAIEEHQLSPDLYYARAQCHRELGNAAQAKEDFVQADLLGHRTAMDDRRRAFGDEYAIDFFSTGIDMGNQNNLTGAAEQFRKAAGLFRDASKYQGDRAWRYASKSLHNLGYYLHVSGGDIEEAKSVISEALEMDPGYKDAWVTLGNIHNSCNENEKAMECYTRSIQLQPNDGRGYYSRGRIHMAKEDYDRGAADFTSAINLYRRQDWRGDAYYNRARCHEGAGRLQEAVADYNEAFNHGIQQGIIESGRVKALMDMS